MTTVLAKIWAFLKDPSKRNFVLGAIAVIILFFYMRSCENNRNLKDQMEFEKKKNEQNQRALTDSLRAEKNKAGEIESVKSSFVATVEELKKLNADLYKDLKKEIGDVKGIINSGISVNNPLQVSNSLINYGDNSYGLKFEKTISNDTIFHQLSGVSKFSLLNNTISPGITDISVNKTRFKITLGFKEVGDDYQVFAKSLSPNIEIETLDGALILPKNGKSGIITPPAGKKKRFGVGPQLGVGVDGYFKPTFYIGVGFAYNIITF